MSGKKPEILRTLRVKNSKKIGTLAKLLDAISGQSGSMGDIKTLWFGQVHNWRDITVVARDEAHFEQILNAVQAIDEVDVEQIIDDVLELHQGGKIRIQPRYPVENANDLRKVYTPGVATVCKKIHANPEQARVYTWITRTVALMTNGSRVLGLGNIGPVASMPVMEGKAALFTQFSGYSMVPILIDTTDPEEFIKTAMHVSKGFGAVQLEDIATPACYEIEDALKKNLNIPVMHDDQHGTAVVALAAAINACKMAGVDIKQAKLGQVGLGAAGSAIARLLMVYTGQTVTGTDVQDHAVERMKALGGEVKDLKTVLGESEVLVSTTGKAGLIKPDQIRKGQIILALSNPDPEITEEEAMAAGAGFYSDGSRVNNLLGFPGIFKGAMDTQAKEINDKMLIAAAETIAHQTPGGEIIPSALLHHVHGSVADAVARAAMDTGVARISLGEEYFEHDPQRY